MSDINGIPFVAVTNNELGERLGDTAKCPGCGQMHPITYGEEILSDGTRVPYDGMSFVTCPDGKIFLVGIDGKTWRKEATK